MACSVMFSMHAHTHTHTHTHTSSLYGIRQSQPVFWEIVTVNFTAIFDRECTDADYYDWMPWDEVGGGV